MAQLEVLVFQNQAPNGVLRHWPMLVIHHPGSRNDLGKEGGIDKINGHTQTKKGYEANNCRLERELKDIHMVSFAFLAWEPESLLVFPDQLQLWSWGSRASELVPLCRVVSHCPETFHSSSSAAAIPKKARSAACFRTFSMRCVVYCDPAGAASAPLRYPFPLFCYPHSSGRSSVSNPFRNYSPKEPHAVA